MTYTIIVKNENGVEISQNQFPTKTKAEVAAKQAAREHKAVVDIADDEGHYLTFKFEKDGTLGGYHFTGEFIDTVVE
jgi:hypothetical protein